MLDHLQKWVLQFMMMHKSLNKYNAIWSAVPANHNLTAKNISYEDVSKCNGKEMTEMSWYLLGVVTQTRWGGSPAQHHIFNYASKCIQALLEVDMFAPYKSHDDDTLSGMKNTLSQFEIITNVFLLRQADKKTKHEANALRMELVNHWKVDEQTKAEMWTLSKKQCEMITMQDYISHKTDVSVRGILRHLTLVLSTALDNSEYIIHLRSYSTEELLIIVIHSSTSFGFCSWFIHCCFQTFLRCVFLSSLGLIFLFLVRCRGLRI